MVADVQADLPTLIVIGARAAAILARRAEPVW